MDYQFEFSIRDENDEEVLTGSTFISANIDEYGNNEVVDMEVGKALRYFKEKIRDKEPEEPEVEDDDFYKQELENNIK